MLIHKFWTITVLLFLTNIDKILSTFFLFFIAVFFFLYTIPSCSFIVHYFNFISAHVLRVHPSSLTLPPNTTNLKNTIFFPFRPNFYIFSHNLFKFQTVPNAQSEANYIDSRRHIQEVTNKQDDWPTRLNFNAIFNNFEFSTHYEFSTHFDIY